MHINIAKINFKPIGINIAKVDFSLYDVANYKDEYLTLSALEDGQITITIPDMVDQNYATSLSYSKDKSNWTETVVDNTAQTITIPVSNGDDVYLKGVANAWCNGDEELCTHIDSSASINASGNIMSLLYGDDFKDKITFPEESQYTFGELFYNNTHLINAKNLILPATTLTFYCYNNMFSGCTSLTTAPELPATTLAHSCYGAMFYGCTSLTTAPELPATNLISNCYNSMFYGCTSLTTAPELPATTAVNSCYNSMFRGCTSLTTAPELPATTLAHYCYQYMFKSCTSLTTAPTILPATTLYSDCYNSMFYGCTSLTTAPELPATELWAGCYNSMFYGCTSLTTAPAILPATTLNANCYQSMFRGCQKLSSITMLATDISASDCLRNWVNGVASTGTFTKAASMTSLPSGVSGIPTGWTVVDYGAA